MTRHIKVITSTDLFCFLFCIFAAGGQLIIGAREKACKNSANSSFQETRKSGSAVRSGISAFIHDFTSPCAISTRLFDFFLHTFFCNLSRGRKILWLKNRIFGGRWRKSTVFVRALEWPNFFLWRSVPKLWKKPKSTRR